VTAIPKLPTKFFQAEDVLELAYASDPQIRPDGTSVAYVCRTNSATTDRTEGALRLVDVRTGIESDIPVSVDVSEPRWSPDGLKLTFVAADDDRRPAIHIYDTERGETTVLASVPRRPRHLRWSPDGTRLAFIMSVAEPEEGMGRQLEKPANAEWSRPLHVTTRVEYRVDGVGNKPVGRDHLFLVDIRTRELRQVTFGDCDDDGPLAWSPDASSLIFSAFRDQVLSPAPRPSHIYRLALADLGATQLTTINGPCTAPSYSPDGTLIAFSGYDSREHEYKTNRIFVMQADGGAVHDISPLDRSLENPRWDADGSGVYATYVDHGVIKLGYFGLDGETHEVATDLAGFWLDVPYAVSPQFSIAPDGKIAFLQASENRTPDVAIQEDGKATKLTHLSEWQLASKHLATRRVLDVRAGDGATVDAWLVLPPDFDESRKWPLILDIHGGPFASYGPMFSTDFQIYASAGYVVLYANPRGSTTQGFDFANAISLNYPGPDYDDLMTAVDAAVSTGFVDPQRMFVTGGSAGGTMTAWIVGKTDRFCAAVAQKPVVNWLSQALTSQQHIVVHRVFTGRPWENFQAYWTRSPLSLIDNVVTPTMLVVGDLDEVTPKSEAEQFYQALLYKGVPTALIAVPDGGHNLSARPSQSAAKANAVLGWFARHDPALSD